MDAPPVLPLALIGAAITLPANIKTREEFYEVIRDKRHLKTLSGASNQGRKISRGMLSGRRKAVRRARP